MAELNLSRIRYFVTAVLADGRLIHLEEVAENIAWEENKGEISVRLNLTLRDIPFENSRLSAQLSLCTCVYVHAQVGDGERREVFQGTIWEWEHSQTHDDAIVITCYDLLYYLQKTTDSKYYTKGKSTKAICEDILGSWSVPLAKYTGPSITHEKTLYKNKAVSAMLTEAVDEARKKTGIKGVVRATEGKCEILSFGENTDIWNFTASGTLLSINDKYSMVDLVTRIIITGKDDKKTGRPKVEATVNGKTEYGILQQVKSKGSTSLSDAKKEANEIIAEKGKPSRTITLQAPDIPMLRKGDIIHAEADRMNDYFYVIGVSHNATSMTMQMEVEPYE